MSIPHASPGTLYLVATPIGNLEDLSDRARRILSEVDLIAAEDSRRTRTLLAHIGAATPIESYHRHTEQEKAARLIARLQEGCAIALVTDAGVPLISDPGTHLVARAWQAGIPVSPIPGPSAVLSALAVAGFPADRFRFAGYPPRKRGDRRAFYRDLVHCEVPVVIYEAPHRLVESLADAAAELGPDRETLIAREMTKQFEEFRRGPLGELVPHYAAVAPLGEFTLVFGPGAAGPPPGTAGDLARAVSLLIAAGLRTGEAADILAAATGIARNDAYALILTGRSSV